MITKENFPKVLEYLDFEKQGDIYKKSFAQYGQCALSANFKNKQLIYPENLGFKINDKTTCNFEKPENFVVFECVHRLLEKGYRPEHIELEKRWNLGHDSKGGKADICVYDKDGKNMLFIIECKTAGREHSKALKLLKDDGGQLFSYWQQERSTKWLSLYASDFKNDELVFDNYIVNCSDDENVKKLAVKDKSILLYENAQTVKELFEVWKETYDKVIIEKGVIFGEDSQAYQIGVPPIRKKNLEDFKPEDKIVNRFEEILRHNNVSDKENAFNRLVALFICKLVDEIQKNDNDIVEFQYKVGTDTYESLQDRLQRLHKEGMEKFMGEEIFYVSDDYAENLFAQKFNDSKRIAAIEDLKNTIRVLKFYSNNDFAFKEVHNEELFFQNGKILVEMVQLFQKYRIVYSSKNQFLGDLFEQLLNKGFKQNEGQFFTPMPITRFIWDCLPLDKVIRKEGGFVLPKVIDYACGSGHFLIEAVEAINAYFNANNNYEVVKDNTWCEHHIFGVEKDYRLARVAKVSLYMNGAGQSKIKFGDGLEQYDEEEISNNTFDILVANPPYSVSGFKSHLKLKNNRFELLEKNIISNNGGEIQLLFVERISQLLKPKGIAAVVLPSTILSNIVPQSFIIARELLLKNFYLRAIVQLGNKTFGATTTTTVVLFLEKFDEPPKKSEIIKDCVNSILLGNPSDDWEDVEIFHSYLNKIGVDEDLYVAFAKESISKEDLLQNEYFAQYNNISNSSEKDFFFQVKKNEYDKLTYFSLVYNQVTLVISAPTDDGGQKKFLGYSWSKSKGSEGIKIDNPGGMIYNNRDRCSNETLAAAVRNSFANRETLLSDKLKKYYSYLRTQDMLDFNQAFFNKTINIKATNLIKYGKFQYVKLSDIADMKGGDTFNSKYQGNKNSNNIPFFKVGDMNTNGNEIYMTTSNNYVDEETLKNTIKATIFAENTIVFPKVGGAIHTNKKRLLGRKAAIDNNIMAVWTKDTEKVSNEYLYNYFVTNVNLSAIASNASPPSINAGNLSNLLISLPPLDIQKQIVFEIKKVDEEYKNNRIYIEEYSKKIVNVFDRLQAVLLSNKNNESKRLNEICESPLGGLWEGKTPPFKLVKVIRGTNFTMDGKLDLKDVALIEVEEKKFEERRLQNGDIIIEKSGGSENQAVGRVVYFDIEEGEYSYSNFTARIRITDDNYEKKYVYCYLNCFYQRGYTFELQSGSTSLKNLNLDKYLDKRIPFLPLSEQQRIVSEIEAYEQKISEAKAVINNCPERKKQIIEKYLN